MNLLLTGFLIWLIYLIFMFTIVYIKKDTSLGNFTWGPGAFLLTLYSFIAYGEFYSRQVIVTILVFLWCLRLTYYVFSRYKKGADPRYVEWLAKWKQPLIGFLFSFVWVVILNGGFSLIMALPGLVININKTIPSLNYLDLFAILLWIIGFIYESVSDYQLYGFTHDPAHKGKVCNVGLWRYSRHPNYFGEIVMWWAIYLLAVSVPYGWLSIVCPIAISTTLIFVTGIPWNEKAMEGNPEYQEYKKHTSMLIPWFVKK